MAIEQFPFTLDQRLGLGRLRAAAWLDDQTVLAATQAALWRWEPATGAVTSFAQVGAELLTVNHAAVLREAGFTVEWNGSINQRPCLTELDWKERREECC